MKAILPAAGFGTRFLPITKSVPKEMLPLGSKPVIQYVVEEAVAAGFDELILVISRDKEIIRNYFEPAPELVRHLRDSGKTDAAAALEALHDMAKFHFVYQPEMKGLGDAIRCGHEAVGDEPFAVLLADTVIHGTSPLAAMRAECERQGLCGVALEKCPVERVSRYGMAGGTETAPGIFRLSSLVEKPSPESAPRIGRADGSSGYMAVSARYFFSPSILGPLRFGRPGKGGEIQVTDAMAEVLQAEGFLGIESKGERLDIGNPAGLLAAQNLLVQA